VIGPALRANASISSLRFHSRTFPPNSADPSSPMRTSRIVSMTWACGFAPARRLANIPMDIEIGDHAAFGNELVFNELARELDCICSLLSSRGRANSTSRAS
jgi:hypothetical protein